MGSKGDIEVIKCHPVCIFHVKAVGNKGSAAVEGTIVVNEGGAVVQAPHAFHLGPVIGIVAWRALIAKGEPQPMRG